MNPIRKILVILYCYPPLLVPATMCYLKLMLGLQEQGVEIDVVTIEPDSFAAPGENLVDRTLEELVPPGIVNHAIWSWETNPFIKVIKRFKVSRALFFNLIEPRKVEWTFPAKKYLDALPLDRYDALLSCSQPHANHLLGLHLKQKTGKPWIAYFSDPWIDNVYAVFESETVRRHNRVLEEKVITHADRVYFTSPEILQLVMAKYPAGMKSKCDVLTHSFVPSWYDRNQQGTRLAEDKLTLVHTGHFYGPRSPEPLFAALHHLQKEQDLSARLSILLYGNMDLRFTEMINNLGLSEVIKPMGTVPYLESLAILKRADYLVLIDAPLTNSAESVFLPSKLVDYLGSGRPIIGITPPVGASARVLTATGNMVCDVADVTGIQEAFRRLLAGSLSSDLNKGEIEEYHYLKVTGKLVTLLAEGLS